MLNSLISLLVPFLAAQLTARSVQHDSTSGKLADPAAIAAPSTAADSVEKFARIVSRIAGFEIFWQKQWRASETGRDTSSANIAFQLRRALAHCHVNASVVSLENAEYLKFGVNGIKSANSTFAVCPSWLIQGVEGAVDENDNIDGALPETSREIVRRARANLLGALDSAAAEFPRDGWLTGQRVRFLFDQSDRDGAKRVALACQATHWWCEGLRGYVDVRNDDLRMAASRFAEMHKVMPVEKRCEWNNLSYLLDPDAQKPYAALSCASRTDVNARVWWLSDPMFRTSLNERHILHDTRRIEMELRKSLPRDERFFWGSDYGGDALAAMLVRYGWPAHSYWAGSATDNSHTGYLNGARNPGVEPYSTFEYSIGRVHTVPAWSAVQKIESAIETSWQLNGDVSNADPRVDWWPREHMLTPRPLYQFDEGQHVVLRRQSALMLAAAADVRTSILRNQQFETKSDSQPDRTAEKSFDVLLLSSPRPGAVDSLAQTLIRGNTTVVLQSLIPHAPTVVGLEAAGVGTTDFDMRARFGIAPPPPLDSMRSGELALSDPVLLRAGTEVLDVNSPFEDILATMRGTSRISADSRRVGVYWEAYGFAATDTVDIVVRIAGEQSIGTLRRLGMSLNIAEDPNRAVILRWTEPSSQHATKTLVGPVPVQMRLLTLDLGQLQPGPYLIEIGMQRKRGLLMSSRKSLTILPR